MIEGTGLLAVWMGIDPEGEADLNGWYEQEHLAERIAIPGFLRARRYKSVQGAPTYLALYDLASPAVLDSEPYLRARRQPTDWTSRLTARLTANIRNEYELVQSIGAGPPEGGLYLAAVRIETAPEHDADLNAWYETEHLAALAAVPGVLAARRYRATAGSPRYLALYELEHGEAPSSEAWRAASRTAFTQRMRPLIRNMAFNLGRRLGAATFPNRA